MKARTKEAIRDGFGGIVNNAAAMRGAKNGPLWLTIVMFFLSILLPVLPLFISAANTNGSAFIRNNSYGLETYITQIAMDKKAEGYELSIGEDHHMTVTKDGNAIDYSAYINVDAEDENKVTGATPIASYIDTVTGEYDLVVYVSNASGSSKLARSYNNYISMTDYKVGTVENRDKDNDEEGQKYYIPKYIIIFKDTIYVVIYSGQKAISASMGGNFSGFKANNECLKTLLEVKDKEDNVIAPSLINPDSYNGVLKNFKKFLDKTYNAIKFRNTFATSGIYLAIFAGLSIFMGLLMWVMTRGKKNPNNYFSIWLCMKIEARLAFTPGLLTFIIGLFLTSYASMIFILTLGLRVMWISMKELRPIQQ